eukprot:46119-Alexandrium_andersonii.AAC.1
MAFGHSNPRLLDAAYRRWHSELGPFGLLVHGRSFCCRWQQAAGVGGPPPRASRRPRPGGCAPG